MGNKTVIVVLGVAAVLLLFIFLFEKGEMTTTERLERKDRVFDSFRRDFVDGLTIEGTSGGTVALQKTDTAGTDGDTFRIVRPKDLDADDGEVTSILSALDYLIAGRVVKGGEEKKKARYGLTTPRLKGAFKIRGKETGFVIGADAGKDGVYLAVTGVEKEFYVVETAFLESIDKSIDDLRSKVLISDDLETAVALELTHETQKTVLKNKNASWQVAAQGSWVLAGESQVHELLHTLQDLKAETFVMDRAKAADLPGYGLGEGSDEILVTLGDKKERVIRIGAPCANQPHQVHVGIIKGGVVACVKDSFLQVVRRPADRLQEKRLAVFLEADANRISLSAGDEELVLARGEEGFSVESDPDFPVDPNAVSDLMGVLTKTTANELLIGENWVSNLKKPFARVVVGLIDDPALELFIFEKNATNQTLIRRGEESALLEVDKGFLDQIRPDKLNYRNRRIRTGDENDVEVIQIEGAITQKLEKIDGVFKLTEPMSMNGDGMGARRVAGLMANIEVKRFVAEKANGQHGFHRPFATITAEFTATNMDGDVSNRTETRQVILELGAIATGKERFARILGEDETVFVVNDAYEDAVSAPLIARDLFGVDENTVVRLSLTTKEASVQFKKNQGKWTREGATESDGSRVAQALTDLGALKTIRAESFTSLEGKKPAVLTLRLWDSQNDTDMPSQIIWFVEKSPDSEENGYRASKANLPATVVLPARIVEDLLSLVHS